MMGSVRMKQTILAGVAMRGSDRGMRKVLTGDYE